MRAAFDAFQQIADVVEREARPHCAEITGFDHEPGATGGRRSLGETVSKRLIDDIAKGPPGSAGPQLQLGGHVIIKSQGGAHIMMLFMRHHDVNGTGTFGE
jgi:hypothetical protein